MYRKTHLLPTRRPPALSVLGENVARLHLFLRVSIRLDLRSRAIAASQVLRCTWQRLDLGIRQARGGFPARLGCFRVVKVWEAFRVGESDFPGHFEGADQSSMC